MNTATQFEKTQHHHEPTNAAEDNVVTVSAIIGEGASAHRVIRAGSWTLTSWVSAGGDEPRIRDIELGERLGFDRPRDIRKLVERLLSDGKLNDSSVRATVARTHIGVAERNVTEYWLSEAAVLKVVAKSETKVADALLDEMIRVYMLARRGLLSATVAAVPQFNLGELGRVIAAAITPMANAVASLSKRLEALEQGSRGSITRYELAGIRQQVAFITRGRVATGLAKSLPSARRWTYNRIGALAGWLGTGRAWALLPAGKLPDVLAELDALRREVDASIGALRANGRQLALRLLASNDTNKLAN